MRDLNELNKYRLKDTPFEGGSLGGAFQFRYKGAYLRMIASVGEGWDHVSVSLEDRCPTWDEMDTVKRLFFLPQEIAMQLHVPVDQHINCHPYVLHLWRPHDRTIPLPPRHLV